MADMGYLWDEVKYQKVQEEHALDIREVVTAYEDEMALIECDPQGHEDRWLVVGQSHTNRILCVVYSDIELPIVRLITAFDASEKWRRLYEQQQ